MVVVLHEGENSSVMDSPRGNATTCRGEGTCSMRFQPDAARPLSPPNPDGCAAGELLQKQLLSAWREALGVLGTDRAAGANRPALHADGVLRGSGGTPHEGTPGECLLGDCHTSPSLLPPLLFESRAAAIIRTETRGVSDVSD
ncbi:hypothetical protein AB1Y20_016137 [Prymnesium parvum]|uniref:Uncharacterized protein n=1 Tax=Prymnesium parvum TaxID=97485 RepID=A0AB34K2J5_PRYPA